MTRFRSIATWGPFERETRRASAEPPGPSWKGISMAHQCFGAARTPRRDRAQRHHGCSIRNTAPTSACVDGTHRARSATSGQ
jgi:hypothetical protein